MLSEYRRKAAPPQKIVAGLNNSDTAGVFLELLKTDPSRVMRGMAIAAYALGAETMILHIPEYAANLADELSEKAKEYRIKIVLGMIDRRD